MGDGGELQGKRDDEVMREVTQACGVTRVFVCVWQELEFMIKCLDTGDARPMAELVEELQRAQDKAIWKKQQEKIQCVTLLFQATF